MRSKAIKFLNSKLIKIHQPSLILKAQNVLKSLNIDFKHHEQDAQSIIKPSLHVPQFKNKENPLKRPSTPQNPMTKTCQRTKGLFQTTYR